MTLNNPSEPPLDFRIINWIGIIEQLTTAKMRQLLDGTDVPPPQFTLLNHFSHRPAEGKTITLIAQAMQQPQPGITKTIAKMVTKGFLREENNPKDGRSKILYLTEAGINAHLDAKSRLSYGLKDTFEGWSETEKHNLYQSLDRLKIYLDNNR